MVLHCAIHLQRDPPVYTPGDMVEGVLVLSSTWADKIHGISVKLVKKLEVEWDTYRLYEKSRVSSVEDVTFLGECEILNCPTPSPSTSPGTSSTSCSPSSSTAISLPCASTSAACSSTSTCSSSSGPLTTFTSKRGLVITRGVQHRYPFLLKIAYELDLPASFNGTYGYIAYKLICFIRAPKKGIFIGTLKDICIYPILDLNHLDHSLQRPVYEKRVFKSLFGYNYVFMKCHMDKRAFLPEEQVSFTVEITNKSPATLDGVEVNLNMSTQFSIYGASKIENLTLLRIRGPCIGQGEHAIWAHSFNFPSCSFPTGFGQLSRLRSKSIDLQYTLLFTLEVSKAEKFMIPFPIVIGTVPYGHNGSRVLCINPHLSTSLEALALGPGAGTSAAAAAGASGGAGPTPGPSSSAGPSTSSANYCCMDTSGRRSGGSVTPSSSISGASSSGFGGECSTSGAMGGASSSSGELFGGSRRPPSESRSSSRCSGGFCCAVRGHHPKCRPRSKSTSALPPSYSATNLYYQCIMLRRAETPPPTYYEAKTMMGGHSNAATP